MGDSRFMHKLADLSNVSTRQSRQLRKISRHHWFNTSAPNSGHIFERMFFCTEKITKRESTNQMPEVQFD